MENNKEETLEKKATKAGVWYTVGNILLKGCVFISLPIFTRLLSTSDFGIYNSYIAYEQILSAIIGLGMYGSIKCARIDFEKELDHYISSVVSLILLVFIALITAVNIFYGAISSITGFSRAIVNCLMVQSLGSALLYFYGCKLNVEFKYKSYIGLAAFNTIGNVLLSILLIVFVFPNERYLGRILGSAFPLVIIAIIIIVFALLRGKTIWSKRYWRYALIIGIPLVPHVVSQSLLSQFDRIMIGNMVGDSEAGIYSYIYTLCTILAIVSSSFENAWNPWVFLSINANEEKKVKEASKDYIGLFTILTIGFMCCMPEVTKIFAGEEYWGGIHLIVPLSIANYFVFLYMLPVNIEYYHKKTAYISLGTIAAAVLNVVLNYFAITRFGYDAAAYTTLISYAALFVFHWLISRKYGVDKMYDYRTILKYIILVLFVGVLLLIIDGYFAIDLIVRYTIIAIAIVLLFCNRKKITAALKS